MATISNMQNARLQLLPETDLFEEIEESLHKLTPMMWIKTSGGGLLGTIISGCMFLTVSCLVVRCTRIDEEKSCSDGISTPEKTKGGRCSGNS